MMYFQPLSGMALNAQNTPPDSTGVIMYLPSVINDISAAMDQLQSADSASSFMQTQWRMAAANMVGIGAITGGWA